MAKLYEIYEHPKEHIKREKSQHWRRGGKKDRRGRFYTPKDLDILKHDMAVVNAERKRGETSNHANAIIVECGCGEVGCFVQASYKNSLTQEKRTEQYLKDG